MPTRKIRSRSTSERARPAVVYTLARLHEFLACDEPAVRERAQQFHELWRAWVEKPRERARLLADIVRLATELQKRYPATKIAERAS